MSAARKLDEIEATLLEIEFLDMQTKGQYREASDREAYDLVCRIERRMRQMASLPDEDGVVA